MEESPEKELSEIEASSLFDIECKVMVLTMLTELRTTKNLVETTSAWKRT